MIYFTGDTHGTIDIAKLAQLNTFYHMTTDDYLIILGDVGLYFDNGENDKETRHTLLSMVKGTILWIDGNHENFDCIDALPVMKKFGGMVHQCDERIFHLMRGEIYEIEGHTFFTFGGGNSIDKDFRTPHISWWEREMPNEEEYEHGWDTLNRHHMEVDYILTHTVPSHIARHLTNRILSGEEALQDYLREISVTVKYKKWFFGHWHQDIKIDEFYGFYQTIASLQEIG